MEITLRGLNLGNFGLDMSALLLGPEYEGVPYACPALAYIIDHPEGRVLFETGLSEFALEEWPAEWQEGVDLEMVPIEHKLEARLKEHGLGPEDFRYVVLGHLHTDHAGGARVFADADVEMVVHEDEYRYVTELESDAEFFYNKVDIKVLDHVSKTLVNEPDFELLPGVRLVHLPGHTPGLMGVVIELEHTGTVMLTTDAMYRHESYGPPPIGSPTVWDTSEWERSIEKIRSMATESEALLFPGHDNEAVKQFATHTELRSIGFMPGHHYA